MSNRLEVSLFGTQYSVGILHMSHEMVKVGMETYGPRKWNGLINDIALETNSGKIVNEISHTIGHTIKAVYRSTGMSMQGFGFGLEVFHGGQFYPVDMVEAKNRTLQLSELMEGYKPKDMLGVFWAKRKSVMLFRWDNVKRLKQEDLSLIYDDLGPVLARKRPFEIVLDITWQGQKGQRIQPRHSGSFETLKHVFHMVK